jgi:hypothetical protein
MGDVWQELMAKDLFLEMLEDSLGLDNLTRRDLILPHERYGSNNKKASLLFIKLNESCNWEVVFKTASASVFREVNHGKFVFIESFRRGSNKYSNTGRCLSEKPSGELLVKLFQASKDWEQFENGYREDDDYYQLIKKSDPYSYRNPKRYFSFKNKEGKIVSIVCSSANRTNCREFWQYYGDEEDIPDFNCLLKPKDL